MARTTSLHEDLAALGEPLAHELTARILALSPGTKGKTPADRALAALPRLPALVDALPSVARTTIALVATRGAVRRIELATAILLRHGAAPEDDRALATAMRSALGAWPITAFGREGPHQELQMLPAVAEAIAEAAERALAITAGPDPSPPKKAGVTDAILAYALTPGLLVQRDARITQEGALHAGAATKLGKVLGAVESLSSVWLATGAVRRGEGGAVRVDVGRCRRSLADPRAIVPELFGVSPYDTTTLWLLQLASAAGPGRQLDLAAALSAPAGGPPHLPHRAEPLLSIDPARNRVAIAPDAAAVLSGERLSVEGKSWIQPDFEIVLSPGVSPDDAFVIGCAAELHHVDRVARLRLTRNAVRAACSLGVSADEIASALVRVGGRELPATVTTALREWSEAGTARVHEVIALEAIAPPQIVERAAQLLGPALRRRLGDVFLLTRAPTAKELAALRAIGLFTEVAVERWRLRERKDQERWAEDDGSEVDDDEPLPSFEPPRRARLPSIVDGEVRACDVRALLDGARVQRLLQATELRSAADAPEGDDDNPFYLLDAAVDRCVKRWSSRSDWLAELDEIIEHPAVQLAAPFDQAGFAAVFDAATTPAVLRMRLLERAAQRSGSPTALLLGLLNRRR
ncbi:MAG: hypothetical protein HYV09_08390 [Deltaproteobacteria bacterium]|nr:hypothetical protein [Deltaproteobacteria bacterium]